MDTAREFEKYKAKAKRLFEDDEKVNQLMQAASEKISHAIANNERMQELVEYVRLIVRMLQAYLRKEYQEIPWKTLTAFGAGLLYFVTPFDLIPDFVPVFGLVDDLSILLWIVRSFDTDVQEFKAWESTQVG